MFIYISTLRLNTLIIYSSKTLSICNFTHHLCPQNTSSLSSRCQQVSTRRGDQFLNQWCNLTAKPNKSVHPIYLQQIQTVYWSGLNIGIWSLWENPAYRNSRKILSGRAGVGRCTGLSNWCTFGLVNQQAGKYITDTELELIMFCPLPLGEMLCHLSTQVKGSDTDAYIAVFDPRRDNTRRFIPFMVYDLFYSSISSNLATLANLSPCYDSVRTHTCSPFLRKPLLRWHRKVETRLIINW